MKNELTLNELRKLKRQAEIDIRSIVLDFHKKTGIWPENAKIYNSYRSKETMDVLLEIVV